MKSHALLLLLVAGICTMVAACTPDVNPITTPVLSTPVDPNGIMPLKYGNRWIYRRQQFDETGIVLQTVYDTLEINYSEEFKGETWYRTQDGVYYLNRKDGLWRRSWQRDSIEVLVARYPAKVGDEFGMKDIGELPTGGTAYTWYKVIAIDKQMTVPSGTYSVLSYKNKIWDLEGTKYDAVEHESSYAPGTGIIQIVSYIQGGKYLYSRSELVAVELH